jgi:hypothetical protein|tara:strand:- start:1100 stop:1690 length:591 start_codon:yes stop_codon:yes gene_type:complete
MKVRNKVYGSYRNIIKCYETALPTSIEQGTTWYSDAQNIAIHIGRLGGYTDHQALFVGAGILSALSPQVEWSMNVQFAMSLVTKGIRKQTWNNHNKAVRILYGEKPIEVLGGKKVRAFYKAVVAPKGQGEPVIDRHALAVYMGRNVTEKELTYLQSPLVMKRVQGAYRKASNTLGIHHHDLQAITWVEWRAKKKES